MSSAIPSSGGLQTVSVSGVADLPWATIGWVALGVCGALFVLSSVRCLQALWKKTSRQRRLRRAQRAMDEEWRQTAEAGASGGLAWGLTTMAAPVTPRDPKKATAPVIGAAPRPPSAAATTGAAAGSAAVAVGDSPGPKEELSSSDSGSVSSAAEDGSLLRSKAPPSARGAAHQAWLARAEREARSASSGGAPAATTSELLQPAVAGAEPEAVAMEFSVFAGMIPLPPEAKIEVGPLIPPPPPREDRSKWNYDVHDSPYILQVRERLARRRQRPEEEEEEEEEEDPALQQELEQRLAAIIASLPSRPAPAEQAASGAGVAEEAEGVLEPVMDSLAPGEEEFPAGPQGGNESDSVQEEELNGKAEPELDREYAAPAPEPEAKVGPPPVAAPEFLGPDRPVSRQLQQRPVSAGFVAGEGSMFYDDLAAMNVTPQLDPELQAKVRAVERATQARQQRLAEARHREQEAK
eukprot:RCo006119